MYEPHDGVAVVRLDNPPVNSLGHPLRQHIHTAVQAALADADVRALVLVGNDKAFSAGADVTEFGKPAQAAYPILPDVLAQLDASTKPVVAAIGGMALGGGLELALCCHARVALASAKLGLPEVNLGLIPGAGGTQRLPRLVGVHLAHSLIHSGAPQTARQLESSGLLDKVVDDGLLKAACALALELGRHPQGLIRARDRAPDVQATHRFIAEQRDKLTPRQRKQPASNAVLDALVASAGDFDEGLRTERALFLELLGSTAAKALRYQFLAEREAGKPAAAGQATARAVHSVAIVGAGTMGSGIAISALDAGLNVVLLEQDAAALQRGQARISLHYATRVSAGKMKAALAAANEARLNPTTDWSQIAQADLVIEAVFEDLAVKQEVFRTIDTHARAGAVLATNTSYLDVDAIANATSRPQDVLGLHFFSPANVMKLLEVVRGSRTAPDVLATGMALGKTLKKIPAQTGNAFGFIGNRIYNAYRKQCEFMLEDGALPEEVDAALEDFGFAMGPFKVADLSGLDIAWRMRKSQAATRDPRARYVDILDTLCEQGRLGRKSGAGYYTYTDGKPSPTVDAAVRRIIEEASARRGIQRRTFAADEIVRRALLAMVNEAALLLSEGVASRASDVDVVLVQGYGFARWQGGPVFWARQQDQANLTRDLQQLALQSGHGFHVADLSVLFST
ncbi:3-hydroxyacyl-CoA dehydrogenase NAD-binding domain-containing protein [Rhodoferax sp. GW822-FHT02A01]|uniref:3-hydroxyacyl-CoA dehydrogenase NAD-binding domain-containing protein n=1 Tax=Rhodoferax sp. GW822-FHT02A01 TaxID=3141537 RepID=UPI00315DD496